MKKSKALSRPTSFHHFIPLKGGEGDAVLKTYRTPEVHVAQEDKKCLACAPALTALPPNSAVATGASLSLTLLLPFKPL